MNNSYLALSWYLSCVLTLTFCLVLLIHISFPKAQLAVAPSYHLYQAVPGTFTQQEVEITTSDARAVILSDFLTNNKSPLASEAETFVQVADKYQLDFRLLPSIAMQESNGGKIIPNDSYNHFGYGVYGSQVMRFGSWAEGIEKVAQGLRVNYLDKGLINPFQIMTKYTPSSEAKGSPWAIGVSTFMEELR